MRAHPEERKEIKVATAVEIPRLEPIGNMERWRNLDIATRSAHTTHNAHSPLRIHPFNVSHATPTLILPFCLKGQ